MEAQLPGAYSPEVVETYTVLRVAGAMRGLACRPSAWRLSLLYLLVLVPVAMGVFLRGAIANDGRPSLTIYEYIACTELGAPCRFPTSVACAQTRRW